jgi:hypothetical protein
VRPIRGGFVVVAVLAVLVAPPSAARTTGSDNVTSFIGGGRQAPPRTWSTLQFVYGHRFCSASLIGPEWVITASHCARGGASGMSFRIGTNDAEYGGTEHTAVSLVKAEGADVTLVRISPPATQRPLRLPDRDPEPGAEIELYGWGAIGMAGEGAQSRVLKRAVTRLTGQGRDHLGAPALVVERIDGIAQPGDSGGPAVIGEIQYGVASTSDLRIYAQYTSLTALRPWIRAVTGI